MYTNIVEYSGDVSIPYTREMAIRASGGPSPGSSPGGVARRLAGWVARVVFPNYGCFYFTTVDSFMFIFSSFEFFDIFLEGMLDFLDC